MAGRSSDPFRNWLRHGDAPERLPAMTPQTAAPLEPHSLTIPPDSDVQEGAIRASMPKRARPLPSAEYTPDGTYIPLSGGARGWYENSGVPNHEAPNRYRFREAIQAEAFKTTILERIETFNRRDSDRYKVDLWVKHSDPNHPQLKMTLRAYCMDLSLKGAKLRLRLPLQAEEKIVISFFLRKRELDEDKPMATMEAKVMHCHPAGGPARAPRFYVGITFLDLEIAAKEAISRLMASGTALSVRE